MTVIVFIGVVILIGYFTIKLKRRNREVFRQAMEQLEREAEALDRRKDYENDYLDIE